MPTLKPASVTEALTLSQDLRPEDESEIRAMSGHKPVVSLSHGV